MGKIRTRVIGDTGVEEEQKKEQKSKAQGKKSLKKDKKVEKTEIVAQTATVVEAKAPKAQKEAPSPKEGSSSGRKEVTSQTKANKRGKKYVVAKKKTEDKEYDLAGAVTLLKNIKYASFDESVELHINVKDLGLRGEVSLPHSTGRTVRVSIVDDTVLEKLEKGVIDFDILITHPSNMPRLAKFARVLGPRGLMPNPKAGTISTNPPEVAKKYSGGLLKWKSEPKFPLVHQMIGKISQEDVQLVENAQKFMEAVGTQHIQTVVIKTTMSPGLRIRLSQG